jgi:CheY-like chemotaxis protein
MIRMPIVNGFEAADAIRAVEANDGSPISTRRLTTTLNGRIPILAVSASLHERQRSSIADVGIDGWILKPIDFKRLNSLMRGLINPMTRREDVYQ